MNWVNVNSTSNRGGERPIIMVAFNESDTIKTLELLYEELSKSNSFECYKIILVWNNKANDFSVANKYPGSKIVKIKGSNRHWDWSGYQEGMRALKNPEDWSSLFFLNDTAFKHPETIALISSYGVTNERGCEYILGRVDSAKSPMIFDLNPNFKSWISTFAFVLSRGLYGCINEVNYYLSHFVVDNNIDKSDIDQSFFTEVHSTVQAHLRPWLFEGGWYKSGPLTAENYVQFRGKLGSILGEFKLTQLILKRGALVNIAL